MHFKGGEGKKGMVLRELVIGEIVSNMLSYENTRQDRTVQCLASKLTELAGGKS